jgi:plasmid stabilization system protein ParE
MRLRESRLAAAELDAIFEYGVANHGIDAAIAYIDEVKRRYRQLLGSYQICGVREGWLRLGLMHLSPEFLCDQAALGAGAPLSKPSVLKSSSTSGQ